MTPDLKELATAWRDYKLNNVSNTAEHIGMLFVHKRNFERAATPEAILSLIAELEQAKKDAERLKKDLSTVDVILEECKMDWSGDVTQIKAELAHGLLALQAERDDWKARALKAEQTCSVRCRTASAEFLGKEKQCLDG